MKMRLMGLIIVIGALMAAAPAQAQEVSTGAKACVVMDMATGRVLLSHNADAPLPMASTTKIMTALVALENADLDDMVTTGRNAFGVPGTSIYLGLGEKLPMEQMLYGLMLASGNDAAVAIAEHVGGSVTDFCNMMNERAAVLGCKDTVFLTPHGLPKEGHQTTAYELALITRAAMENDTFRKIVSTQRATIPWAEHAYDRVLNNKNKLLTTYEGAVGVKTGYTKKAGRCLVFGAEREGMRILGVVLHCADWFDEAARLMDLAFARYDAVTMLCAGDSLREIPVEHSDGMSVHAVLAADLTGVVPASAIPAVEIDLPESLDAPIYVGDTLGQARLVSGGETICAVDLLADKSIARDDFPARWDAYWNHWLLMQ